MILLLKGKAAAASAGLHASGGCAGARSPERNDGLFQAKKLGFAEVRLWSWAGAALSNSAVALEPKEYMH